MVSRMAFHSVETTKNQEDSDYSLNQLIINNVPPANPILPKNMSFSEKIQTGIELPLM